MINYSEATDAEIVSMLIEDCVVFLCSITKRVCPSVITIELNPVMKEMNYCDYSSIASFISHNIDKLQHCKYYRKYIKYMKQVSQ